MKWPREVVLDKNLRVQLPHKYVRIERERRFLLDRFPSADVVRVRHITDRYIDGAFLRLREQTDDGGPAIFKLTQKVPARASGGQQGFITNMYLTEEEFRVLAQLPAKSLCKARYSVPPFGIDVFEGALRGLQLAEAEFDSAEEADALIVPSFILHEVTDDDRFTGGRLVCASRQDVERWLAEYGIPLYRSPVEVTSLP
jgi:CYTH domain-containing protein